MTEIQMPAEFLIPRVAELEAENEQLRQILAELLLRNQVLREKTISAQTAGAPPAQS